MNRPIKFRVWDKANNKFIDPFRFEWNNYYKTTGMVLLDLNGKIRIADYAIGNGDNSASSVYSEVDNPDNYIAQQYTGLIDKNGKEIYEGDIVKYNPDKPNIERIGIIEFSNYHNGWSIKDSHCYPLSDFGVYSLSSPFLSFNWTEIVGNIFEHSELLK